MRSISTVGSMSTFVEMRKRYGESSLVDGMLLIVAMVMRVVSCACRFQAVRTEEI